MARPRTPSKVLELRGAYARNPGRRRNEPAADTALGEPPAHLSEAERAAWNEFVNTCHPGTLCHADRLAVEMAAVLLTEFRTGDISGARLGRLDALLTRFGLTPGDRARVSVARQDDDTAKYTKFVRRS